MCTTERLLEKNRLAAPVPLIHGTGKRKGDIKLKRSRQFIFPVRCVQEGVRCAFASNDDVL